MHENLIDPTLAQTHQGPTTVAVLCDAGYPRATPRHRHSRGQLLGALRGLITVGVDGARWLVPASHAVWLPPHIDHEFTSHGAFAGWSVYVSESDCVSLPTMPCTLRSNALLREAVRRAAAWGDAERNGEIRTMPRENLRLPMPTDARTLRVAQQLLGDLADKRSADDWAREAGMSPRTFLRYFTHETGFGFAAWRQHARLMRALEMLAGGQKVTSIALDLGYDSTSAFIDMFRRNFGVTPTKYFAADHAE
jgi:AraC-like DNA-binding protein